VIGDGHERRLLFSLLLLAVGDAAHCLGQELHRSDMYRAVTPSLESTPKCFLKEVIGLDRTAASIGRSNAPQPAPIGVRQAPDRVGEFVARPNSSGIRADQRTHCHILLYAALTAPFGQVFLPRMSEAPSIFRMGEARPVLGYSEPGIQEQKGT
jgi:hypothetical protein